MKILPAILCGGSGARLWPLSRTRSPKQLQALTSEQTMVVETVARVTASPECLPPCIISGTDYAEIIAKQLTDEGFKLSGLISEPMGRDTCAATASVALFAQELEAELNEPLVVLLLPADHFIGNIPQFHSAIRQVAEAASQNWIATLSIHPNKPETGYGYIRREASKIDGLDCYQIAEFVEKPPLDVAKTYLESGNYSWNSGMFAFRADTFLTELQSLQPEIFRTTKAAWDTADKITTDAASFKRVILPAEEFSLIPKISIDYGVMEKTDRACTLPVNIDWNDIGSWSAIHEVSQHDEAGNVVLSANAMLLDSQNCLVRSETKRLIATIGLTDIGIVDLPDALLVTRLDRSQDVKKIHAALSDVDSPIAHAHPSQVGRNLNRAKAWASDWLYNKALPLWISEGLDRKAGGAFDALTRQGAPILDMPKRMRVQARQCYVLAQAGLMGHNDAANALHIPLDFMMTKGYLGKGRFAVTMDRYGTPANDQCDTYELAFVLYSLAYVYKLTGEKKYKVMAETTLAELKSSFAHESGGYVEGLPNPTGPRRANPHMHMLEAALAWVDLHQSEPFAALARELVDLFYNKFFIDGLLREYFEDDLSLISSNGHSELLDVEPGHLCEWSWLLQEYGRIMGEPMEPIATMTAFVDSFGKEAARDIIVDRVAPDGTQAKITTSRLWPQTEYIRWKLSQNTPKSISASLSCLEDFRAVFLNRDGEEPGHWIDQISSDGNIVNDRAPASSFYHVMTMMTCLLSTEAKAVA